MIEKDRTLQALKDTGVVAILRADKAEDLVEVGRALAHGGVKLVEITMTVPGALNVIEKAVATLAREEVFIGAGTVLDGETARLAILAGAGYVVSPVVRPDVIAMCRRYSVPVMPGALSPTEILQAWEAGADVVKVFPAGIGGPQFFKDVKGPLPHIAMMPTGGVNLQTAPQFIKAGACAVGVGGELASKTLIAKRDFDALTKNAREFVRVVSEARSA